MKTLASPTVAVASVPGPTLYAQRGDTVKVNFTNNLPESTTVHWHGVKVPAGHDGSHISQVIIPGNGGTFTYEFKVLAEGLKWYHPHVRTFDQVEKGLHGLLRVEEPPAQRAALGLTNVEEHLLVFDDILLDA